MPTVKRAKPVAKRPAKKVAPKAPAKAAAKATTPAVKGEVSPIMPGDPSWDDTLRGRRGKPDTVSPHLDPLVDPLIVKGEGGFQLVPNEPFTINQVRNYAYKRNLSLSGLRVRISGGTGGKNIGVEVVPATKADDEG